MQPTGVGMLQVGAALTRVVGYKHAPLEEASMMHRRAHTRTRSSQLRTWSDVFSVLPAIIILAWETDSVSSISEALHQNITFCGPGKSLQSPSFPFTPEHKPVLQMGEHSMEAAQRA